MEIDVVTLNVFQTLQRRVCFRKLIGANAEIDVAIRPQRRVRIKASDGPTFDEHRLDACRAQRRNHFDNLAFMQQRRQTEATIDFVKLPAGSGVSERRIAQPAPGERAHAGATKRRCDGVQIRFGKIEAGIKLTVIKRTLVFGLWT